MKTIISNSGVTRYARLGKKKQTIVSKGKRPAAQPDPMPEPMPETNTETTTEEHGK